ncbi:MAG: ParB/RepB/Spo0J family partition protein [Lachnospiraceae bacterium]|nr:ParB/RepB/Spo0J family partition protein [Lachnospiraceae bacterium]
MKGNIAEKIKMTSLDDLLGVTSAVSSTAPISSASENKVVSLPLELLHEFANHPFRVLDDEKMAETVDSIREHGILMPGIVRPDGAGGYEIIAGHRRHHAAGLAGLTEMPVIVKDLSDEEATVIMVDSNIQREDLLPSERAKAYRMKYDALKQMGAGTGARNDEILAKQSGESRNTIQRYIRLTYLTPDLLQMVDAGRLPKNTASELSYLKAKEQEQLFAVIEALSCIPSGEQAQRLKEYSKNKTLSPEVMELLLERRADEAKVSLKQKDIRKYFPESYTGEQIEKIIYRLLQEWQEKEGNTL